MSITPAPVFTHYVRRQGKRTGPFQRALTTFHRERPVLLTEDERLRAELVGSVDLNNEKDRSK